MTKQYFLLYNKFKYRLIPKLSLRAIIFKNGGSLLNIFNDRTINTGYFSNKKRIYEDPINQRNLIRNQNNGKIGVYVWINKLNGKFYVGSGDPLYLRISDYYQKWYLKSRTSLYIVRALNKYSMINFTLIIIEYTSSENLISCEQKWIDLLKPEYNLNPIASSSKGYIHTLEAISKMRMTAIGRKHTDKVKESMSINRRGKNNPFFGKKHSDNSIALIKAAALNRQALPKPGLEVEILDLETKLTTIYNSVRKAAIAINSDIKTILRREKLQREKGNNTPYRKRYIITIKRD